MDDGGLSYFTSRPRFPPCSEQTGDPPPVEFHYRRIKDEFPWDSGAVFLWGWSVPFRRALIAPLHPGL